MSPRVSAASKINSLRNIARCVFWSNRRERSRRQTQASLAPVMQLDHASGRSSNHSGRRRAIFTHYCRCECRPGLPKMLG